MKTRRDFLKTTSMAAAGAAIIPSSSFASAPATKVRLGFIGVGLRGQSHLELALRRSDCEVVALCDIQQSMMDSALKQVADAGKAKPATILDGPYGYRKLLQNKDIDAVIIATPWEWHTIQCIDAMKAGKYVGCE